MRNRFKNIRKAPSRIGLNLIKPPPVKKLRMQIKHPAANKTVEQTSTDATIYERNILYMKKHPLQSSRMNVGLKMMRETRSMRATWIRDAKPQVPEILEEFPYLSDSKIVSNHACSYNIAGKFCRGKVWRIDSF